MIAVAISILRHRISSGSLIRSGIAKDDFHITGAGAEQSVTLGLSKPFMVVVLPDGTLLPKGSDLF
jgi:hypothetical protein